MGENICRGGGDVRGHVAPAAITIVATGELNRTRAIRTFRVDVGASLKQPVDEIELPCHRGPMNRLIASAIARIEKFGRLVEQLSHQSEVAIPNCRGDHIALW